MFFDVFPTLEVNGDMKKLLSETEVTKVGMNHEKDHIRIYLNGKRLIHKKNIYQLEKNIHDQIFKNRHMDVKVIEKYQLSEQYTAEKLMDLYKDSILEELKNYSLMEYNLLRSAKMEFTGDSHLLLTLENTIIAQTRSHEIVEFLEKVVCERCGLDLSVELAFEEPKESKHKKNSDLQIQFEIKNILKRVQLHEDDTPVKVESQDDRDVQTANMTTKTATKESNNAKESANAGNNAKFAANLFVAIKPYTVTNISEDRLMKLFQTADEGDGYREWTVPGEGTQGLSYDEYHVDDDALYAKIMETFYQEIK